ncbi:MAG: hypothetical protein AAF465_17250, partial [Pseudomonadota bacterium]
RGHAQSPLRCNGAKPISTHIDPSAIARTVDIKLIGRYCDGLIIRLIVSGNSRGVNVSGNWLRAITPQWRLGVTADAGQIDYASNLDVKDVNRFRAGLVGVYQFGENGQGQWLTRVGAGMDDPRQSLSRYARDFLYATTAVSWQFNPRTRVVVSALYESSQFDEIFFEQLYDRRREDDRARIAATIDWSFRPRWRLSHSLAYTQNDTFVDIFEYERFEALLRIRYKFD